MKSALNIKAVYAMFSGGLPFQMQIDGMPDLFQQVFSTESLAKEFSQNPHVRKILDTNMKGLALDIVRVNDAEKFLFALFDNDIRVMMDVKVHSEHRTEWGEVIREGGHLFLIDNKPA